MNFDHAGLLAAVSPGASAVDPAAAAAGDMAPSRLTGMASGLCALLLVGLPALWRLLGHLDTAIHEGGHALAAFLLNRTVRGVWLFSDQSGLTIFRGRPGAGLLVIGAAGYTAPSLCGLAAAGLLSAGNVTAAFILAGAAGVSLLLVTENAFGRVVLLATLTALGIIATRGSPGLRLFVACTVTWFLLFAAIRSLNILRRARRYTSSSDADMLAALTHLPGAVWVAIFYAVDLYCLLRGGRLLLDGWW